MIGISLLVFNSYYILQVEKRRDARGKRRKRFVEGWVEFKKKSLAKRIAASLNNTAVGGKRRNVARESLWTMKYLSGFDGFFFHPVSSV